MIIEHKNFNGIIATIYYRFNNITGLVHPNFMNIMKDQNLDKNLCVQHVKVGEEYIGQRLDNYLITKLKKIPKSHVYKIIRSGQIRVNKKRVSVNYRLQSLDLIRIPPLFNANYPSTASTSHASKKPVGTVIYEDNDLLILNKLPGIAVHGGSGIHLGVIEALRLQRNQPSLELVHRLDRDTSGCLIIAKKRSALKQIHAALLARNVEKTYLALVWHPWHTQDPSCIDLPLKKFLLQGGERVVKVKADGKSSQTFVESLKNYSHFTLLKIKPLQGRTHQIRVHLAHINHPIVGDEKYGMKELDREFCKRYGSIRLFLHAHSLKFQLSNRTIQVEASLEPAFSTVLSRLT